MPDDAPEITVHDVELALGITKSYTDPGRLTIPTDLAWALCVLGVAAVNWIELDARVGAAITAGQATCCGEIPTGRGE